MAIARLIDGFESCGAKSGQHVIDRLAQAIVEGRQNDAYEHLRELFPDRVPHMRVHKLLTAGRAKDARYNT